MQTIYVVPGALDAPGVTTLKRDFEMLAESASDVTLDLTKTDFLDSSGVGAIVFLYKRLFAGGYRLDIAGVDGQPLRLLKFLRVTEVVPVREAAAA